MNGGNKKMNTIFCKKYLCSNYVKLAFVLILTVFFTYSCGGGGGGGDTGDTPAGDDTLTVPVRSASVISDSTAPLLAMATNENDVSFWFYAVRNEQGVPEYIDELVLTEMNDDLIQEIISIAFDDQQRVSKVTLPDLQGEMTLTYISSDEVEVTVTASDGVTETIIVPNPYVDRSASRQASAALQDAMCRDWAGWPVDTIKAWSCVIEACEGGPRPVAKILKDNSEYAPKIRSDIPGYYHISYQIAWVDDYEMWESYCRCMKNITATLLAGENLSETFSVANSVAEGLESIVSYFMGEAKEVSVRTVCTDMGDSLFGGVVDEVVEDVAGESGSVGGGGVSGTAIEIAELIANSGDSCSNDVFERLRQNVFQPIEIKVVYSGRAEKSVAFDPDQDEEIPQISFAELCTDYQRLIGRYSLGSYGIIEAATTGTYTGSCSMNANDDRSTDAYANFFDDGTFEIKVPKMEYGCDWHAGKWSTAGCPDYTWRGTFSPSGQLTLTEGNCAPDWTNDMWFYNGRAELNTWEGAVTTFVGPVTNNRLTLKVEWKGNGWGDQGWQDVDISYDVTYYHE